MLAMRCLLFALFCSVLISTVAWVKRPVPAQKTARQKDLAPDDPGEWYSHYWSLLLLNVERLLPPFMACTWNSALIPPELIRLPEIYQIKMLSNHLYFPVRETRSRVQGVGCVCHKHFIWSGKVPMDISSFHPPNHTIVFKGKIRLELKV